MLRIHDDITQMLKSSDITPTAPRVEIAQILFARPQHMAAEQVLNIVNEQSSVVSKATVYNTLGLFVEKGLLKEVIVDPNKVFYDSNITPHFHFFNTDTGELIDIPLDAIQMEKLPDLPKGTVSSGLEVIVRIKNS